MLELSEILKNIFISQDDIRKLISILEGNDNVYVKAETGGHILLSNGAVLECVSKYYELPKNTKKFKNVDLGTSCKRVRQALGISDEVPGLLCRRCHLVCANKELDDTIVRKKKEVKLL